MCERTNDSSLMGAMYAGEVSAKANDAGFFGESDAAVITLPKADVAMQVT